MSIELARKQLAAIERLVEIADQLGTPAWLRGGWAVDFYLGEVTRQHADIDWFALSAEAPQLATALLAEGYRDVTTAPHEQQIDLALGDVEHGIALIHQDANGEPTVAGGPWAGAPWPSGMLDGPRCLIDGVAVRVIAPEAQIEIKEMTPIWNPQLPRRKKDAEDIRRIRAKLGRGSASPA